MPLHFHYLPVKYQSGFFLDPQYRVPPNICEASLPISINNGSNDDRHSENSWENLVKNKATHMPRLSYQFMLFGVLELFFLQYGDVVQ